MTSLAHWLASPFPSPQGTQAAVASMLRAEVAAGLRPSLLAYPERFGADPSGVSVKRTPRAPLAVGARSGPSLARLAHDALAVPFIFTQRGSPLLAHNVEAACIARAAGARFAFVAHTSFERELPSYEGMPTSAAVLGTHLDRAASGGAVACAAIAPALASMLESRWSADVTYLPIPWPVCAHTEESIRVALRAERGIEPDEVVLLHAGNLDGYQGLETLAATARVLQRETPVRVVLATESDPTRVRDVFAGLRCDTARLATEGDRHDAHAIADVVVLARSAEGGLPIKLLEAFARGLPVVATGTSLAGLPVPASLARSLPNDARALAAAALAVVGRGDRGALRATLAERGRRYLEHHHSDAAYLTVRDRLAIALGAGSPRIRR